MDKQKLIEKLAGRAGFEDVGSRDKFKRLLGIKYPDGCIYSAYPNFPQSLDACFKWLVPKLQDRGNNVELYACKHKGYRATVYKDFFTRRGSDGYDPCLEPVGQAGNDNPALALCLAVEKLIDGGEW